MSSNESVLGKAKTAKEKWIEDIIQQMESRLSTSCFDQAVRKATITIPRGLLLFERVPLCISIVYIVNFVLAFNERFVQLSVVRFAFG